MRLKGHYCVHAGHTNNKYYNIPDGEWRGSCMGQRHDNATHCYTRRTDDSFASQKKFYCRFGSGVLTASPCMFELNVR